MTETISTLEDQYKYCPLCATELAAREVDHRNLLACPNCPYVHWNNPKPCASAIIVKDGKLLLLRRALEPLIGQWVLPGGYMDTGDSPEGTAIREVREETGLTFTPQQIVGAYKSLTDPRGHHIDIIYAGVATGELKVNPNEHTEGRYFALEALPDQIAYEHPQAIVDWQKVH